MPQNQRGGSVMSDPSSRVCRRRARDGHPWHRASSAPPAPSSRSAWDGSRTTPVENPPRRSAPAPASPPSAPPGPSPSGSPAAASFRQPSVCTGVAPDSAGSRLFAAQPRVLPGSSRLRSARRRGSTGRRLPLRRGSASLAPTLPAGRHPCRSGHATHGNVAPEPAWPRPTADIAVLALSRAAYRRRGR
jgi:hypothetical protein